MCYRRGFQKLLCHVCFEGVEARLSDEQTSQIFFLPRTVALRPPASEMWPNQPSLGILGAEACFLTSKQTKAENRSWSHSLPLSSFCPPWLLFISPVNPFWASFSEQRFWPDKKLTFIERLLCASVLTYGSPSLWSTNPPPPAKALCTMLWLPHIYF